MKKIWLVLTIVFTVLTLSGCDLLSEDLQDKISEELCKEDPDNELCDLDALSDLEDDIVMDFVEDFHKKVKDGTLADTCMEYISPSNPDLLMKCREGDLMFLPEGIDTFTPVSVIEDGNMYTIMAEEIMNDKELYVKVTIVDIDGKFYIEDYSFKLEEKMMKEISEEEGNKIFIDFFTMLPDRSKSNKEFCDMFFDGVDDDCNLFRESFNKDYRDIATIEVTSHKEYEFRGHVTVLKAMDNTGGTGLDVTLELAYNDDDDLRVKFVAKKSPNPIHDEATTEAMNMLYDYVDSSMSDDDFEMMYKFADYNSSRSNRGDSAKMVDEVTLLYKDIEGNKLVLYVHFRQEFGPVQTHRLDVMIDSSGDKVMYEYAFVDPEIITDLDTAKHNIDSFFDVFTDLGEDRYRYSSMYYGSGMNLDTFVDPNVCPMDMFMVEGVYESEMAGEFLVRAKFPPVPCSDGRNYQLNIRVNRWESRTVIDINDIDNDCDGICEVDERTDMFMLYSMYLEDYMNKDITDTELISMYFDSPLPESFHDIRKEVQAVKNKSLYDVVGPIDEDTYIFLVLETEGDMTSIVQDTIIIRKRIDKATPLLAFVDPDSDGDSVPYDEKVALNNELMMLLNDETKTDMEACKMVIAPHRIGKCSPIRQHLMDMGYEVYEIELFIDMDGNNFLRIKQRPDLLTQAWDALIDESLVYYYYDESGKLLIELVKVPDEISSVEAEDDWNEVVSAMNDSSIPIEEICPMLSTVSYDTCSSMRTRATATETMIVTTNFEMIEGVYHVTVQYRSGDEMQGEVYMYTLRYVNDDAHNYSILEITETPSGE